MIPSVAQGVWRHSAGVRQDAPLLCANRRPRCLSSIDRRGIGLQLLGSALALKDEHSQTLGALTTERDVWGFMRI